MTRLTATRHAISRLLGAASFVAAFAACGDVTTPPPSAPAARPALTTTATSAVAPTIVPSVSSCPEIRGASPRWRTLTVDPVVSGTYSNGEVTVTLTVAGRFFSWSATSSSTTGIDAVLAKAAPSSSLYRYDPPEEATADGGLSGPMNKLRKDPAPIPLTAVLFCYDFDPA